jgi:hypothetical protein
MGLCARSVFSGCLYQDHTRRQKQKGPQGPHFQFLAERVGLSLRDQACGCAAAPVEQGPKSSTTLGKKTKWPRKGAISFSGGEGGIVASRPGMRLRRCACRTGSEVLNHTRQENKMAPQGGHFIFWRRGWDSNPRYGRTVHLISSQAHSTTLAPLRCCVAATKLYAGDANFNSMDYDKNGKINLQRQTGDSAAGG